MSKATLWVAAAALVLLASAPASAQNFVLQSAETIDQGNFKLGAYPVLLFGKDDVVDEDNTFGVAGRFGYGFTPSFDVEAKLGFFDGFKMYGADAEYWLVKGPVDVSLSGGFHLVDSDIGADSKAFDVAGLVSGRVADKLDLYGGLSVSFESLDDTDFNFERVYLTPGIEYKLGEDVDLVAEFGLGLNDNSPNYVAGGLSFYIR
jgi:hypothetical protein